MKLRKVKGWPYLVSDCGEVISQERKVNSKHKCGFAIRKRKILKQKTTMFGYKAVTLQHNKNKKHAFVHGLVAEAFLGKRKAKMFVNHKDGNKTNNRVENLEWVTAKENMDHAYKNKLIKPVMGDKHGRRKLSSIDILEIRSSNLSRKELKEKFNVTDASLSLIINRKVWKHI